MYLNVVKNSEGEPVCVEYVRDAQEENEAYLEEMQMRADDPYYAQMREKEEWYYKALQCFEEKGIEVPPSVVQTLSRELRKKQIEIEEQKALDEVKPVVDFLNEHFPDMFEARYEWPTPEEYGYAYIDFKDYSNRPYRDEIEPLIEPAIEQDIHIQDYISLCDFRTRNK